MSFVEIVVVRPSVNTPWFVLSEKDKEYISSKYRHNGLRFEEDIISNNGLSAKRVVKGKLDLILEYYNELTDPKSIFGVRQKYYDENGCSVTYNLVQ